MYIFFGCKISPYPSHRCPKVDIQPSSAGTAQPQGFVKHFLYWIDRYLNLAILMVMSHIIYLKLSNSSKATEN